MNTESDFPIDLAAWKAQQEANREAYLRRCYSPAELWRQQQTTLTALEKLRPKPQRQTTQNQDPQC